jgi:cytochrome P450 family 9
MEYDTRIYNHFKGHKFFGLVEFRVPTLYIRDVELMRKVLVKDFDHFVDRKKMNFSENDLFAKMLIQRTGKEWKDLRSVMSPTFTTSKIKRMFAYFNICADQFANHLRQKDSQEVDFQDEFGKFTVSVIASIVFGIQTDVFTDDKSQFMKMVKKMQTISVTLIIKFFLLMLVPKVGKVLKLSFTNVESLEYFSAVIKRSIQKRRDGSGEENRQDFLQMMLEAQAGQAKLDEKELDNYEKDALLKDTTAGTGKRDLAVVLDDETVIAQAFLFFSAGLDTIQTALTFAAYEIGVNPDVQERLAEEIIPIMEKNDGALTYESVHEMAYLDMVVSETLRKNPPAFFTERQCTAEYKIPETDVVIPKGMSLLIPINAIHHDENYYPDPEKFNPENFNAENKAKRHPYAYLPFGIGPRNCIAMRFALVETKAALAHLIYNFKIEPCEKTVIPMTRDPKTAKPVSCWLKFQPRMPNAN